MERLARPALLEEALAFGGPIVVFDHVSLAFDEKVILRNISFTLKTAHTKIFLGASGAGKSTILRLILGLLKPDSGQIFVNGERVDNMKENALMQVRADLGMVFQEGALFDSLSVRENVGYKLFEEAKVPFVEANRRVEEVLDSSASRSTSIECRPSCPAASGAASPSRARWRRSRGFCC
ncbi:MAG TPA: ATP-binding cassette domain-containing protein, partial [Vicinamibacterales bacterium]|nr:ATP-binding cassette domain-containing protein [Vicinamibacterales bacterium]